MVEEIISVSEKNQGQTPNLKSYEAIARAPQWDCTKTELSWFEDGEFNAAYNAIDRHVGTAIEQKPALLWEDDAGKTLSLTFGEVARLSNQYANLLSVAGVASGDRVFLFLPRVPACHVHQRKIAQFETGLHR